MRPLSLVLLAAPFALGTDSLVLDPIATNTSSRRALASAGCNACCMQNDCSLAFSQSQPGVCCGAHRTRGQIGCCPMGASCVPCANIWKCTMSRTITRSAMCHICSDDMPRDCMYQRRGSYGGYHSGGTSIFSILFLLLFVGCIAMMFCGRNEPDVVMVQQPQMVMGPNGQPMQVINQQPMYGGGFGFGSGGGDGAGAAATGFVGGMVVGEMMDHGDHGYGYGGGYGGGYGEGGYGGDMGGGDGGFGADQ